MTPQSASFLLPLLAPLLYATVLLGLSRLSGWRGLSRRHPLPTALGPLRGRIWRGSLRIGNLGHYNSSVILSLHDEGLRIAPWFHLRIGHRPFFLTWEDMQCSLRSRLWILEGLDIRTREGERLWIPIAQARRLRTLSKGRFWPTPARAPEPEPAPASGRQATLQRG